MSEVKSILKNNNHDEKNKTIAIVCHGGTIRIVLCSVLNLALKNIWNMRQESTALNIIDYNDSNSLVSLLNDTSHLEDWWEK
jgi:alpha-ribazole phosphatase